MLLPTLLLKRGAIKLKNAPSGIVKCGDVVAFELVPVSSVNPIDSAVLLLDGQRVRLLLETT